MITLYFPGGQLKLGYYSFDGAISYVTATGNRRLALMNFHSAYSHGCRTRCPNPLPDPENRQLSSECTDKKIKQLLLGLSSALTSLKISYQVYSDCPHHGKVTLATDPEERLLTVERTLTPEGQNREFFLFSNFYLIFELFFLFSRFFCILYISNKNSNYENTLSPNIIVLNARILSKKLQGFVVVQNLHLVQSSHNPHMGFCIQRCTTIPSNGQGDGCLSDKKEASGIIGGNNFIGIHCLSTAYYTYLAQEFGFRKLPVILHAVFYKHTHYLRSDVHNFLRMRQQLKRQGTVVALAKATFLKLILNSVYGYTLCRINTEATPFSVEFLRSYKYQLANCSAEGPLVGLTRVGSSHVAVQVRSYDASLSIGTPLGSVGATILGGSKVLLLEAIGFLVRYLDPSLAELVYVDTDSVFLALHAPELENNVSPKLRNQFVALLPQFVNTRDCNLLSGYLLLEASSPSAIIWGEKLYSLIDEGGSYFKTRMKGVPHANVKHLTTSQGSALAGPNASMVNVSNTFKRSLGAGITMATEVKKFKLALNPRKRLFSANCHSLPWC